MDGNTYQLDSSGYDTYRSSAMVAIVSITKTAPIATGWNYLKIVVNGKNASSTNYIIGIYGVRLR
ncbi:MAG: hypothetical protein PHS80_00050 [Methanothrix sp.]|nr:hypothetical protein [Methanothrix sp.]